MPREVSVVSLGRVYDYPPLREIVYFVGSNKLGVNIGDWLLCPTVVFCVAGRYSGVSIG